MKPYDHKKIEKKWQKEWEKKKIYRAVDSSPKPKFFSLIEFPYPSGEGLHVGHIRSNTAMDIISRKRRMEGFNVLYPIGWDAFGLPTENYAIKTGVKPQAVTKKNTDTFRKQLKSGGFSFDWSREIDTTDPNYYRWTQWVFLQMYKKGLAYKKKMVINWCPKDKIGLANEEVVDGKCERCGTPVEKREKEQWMLAITKYADRLDKDLDTVDYLEKIKIQQRNWIGRSEGAEIEFKIKTANAHAGVVVFTTRADTLFGVTYVVLAPEHELVQKLKDSIKNWTEVEKYIKAARNKEEMDRTAEDKDTSTGSVQAKSGVELKGVKAINPANGEAVPVWIADYVLSHYGTGAVMAVPAHDERDFAFAKKYNLPIKYVIAKYFLEKEDPPKPGMPMIYRKAVNAFVRNPKDGKFLVLDWKTTRWKGPISGGIEDNEEPIEAARREILEETGYKNLKFVKFLGNPNRVDFYHPAKKENRSAEFVGLLFDLENEECDPVDAKEKINHEPKWLTYDETEKFLNTGKLFFSRINQANLAYTEEGKLVNSDKYNDMDSEKVREETGKKFGKIVTTYKLRDWIFSRQRYWGEPIPMVNCAKCGWVTVPEKELPVKLPNVKKYQPTDTGESPLAAITKWVNTKCPQCKGPAKRETDTMPNWAGSSWYFLRYVDPKNKKALADTKKLEHWMPIDWYNGGMEHTTLHLLYSRFWNKFLFDIGVVPTSEPYKKRTSHGLILAEGGEKMSKSKGNVVNPDTIIESYGADTLRFYEMFMGPFDQAVAWSTEGIIGPRRFLERVWKLQEKVTPSPSALPLGKGGEAVTPSFSKEGARGWSTSLENALQRTIKKVTDDIESMQFNTAVSALMILSNEFEKTAEIPQSYYETFLKLLSPFAPHITEEIWAALGHKKSIHLEMWPQFDVSKVTEEEVIIIVQVNGKVRGQFNALPTSSEEDLKKRALELPEVKKWTDGKEIKKVICIKGKLVNIVVM